MAEVQSIHGEARAALKDAIRKALRVEFDDSLASEERVVRVRARELMKIIDGEDEAVCSDKLVNHMYDQIIDTWDETLEETFFWGKNFMKTMGL